MKPLFAHTLVLVLLSLGACGDATEPIEQVQNEATVREAIEQLWQKTIEGMENGDASALVPLYTEDLINMPSYGSTQNGPSEVEAMWEALFSSSTIDVQSHTTTEVFVHDGMAYELGAMEFEQKPRSSDQDSRIRRFRYVSVFQQQSDGTWKFHRWLAQSEAEE